MDEVVGNLELPSYLCKCLQRGLLTRGWVKLTPRRYSREIVFCWQGVHEHDRRFAKWEPSSSETSVIHTAQHSVQGVHQDSTIGLGSACT